MNLFGLMDVSASALQAQRVRAEVVAANMANAETTRTAEGGPYQRQHVVFEAEDGGAFGNSFLEHAKLSSAEFTSRNSSMSHLKGIGLFNGGLSGGLGGAEGVAVKGIIADTSEPLHRYEPGHPDADAQGFVAFPDINPLTEMVDLMGASRSYGMNASAVQAEKTMIAASMDLGK